MPTMVVDGERIDITQEEYDALFPPGPTALPVPFSVSRFQAKAALSQANLLATVEAAVAGADDMTKLAWVEAVEFRRDSPAINAISAQLGMTVEQMDDLFRAAILIQA